MSKNRNNQSISEKADSLISQYYVKPNANKEEVLDTILNKISEKETKPVRRINWYRVAGIPAAATIAILLALYFFTATVTISAGEGATLTHRMPDNSHIVLHSCSVVEYGKYIKKRQVALTGEAYFEVEKGDGFVVKTGNGIVSVLGTRFLVSASTGALNVKCYEGKVKTDFNRNSWVLEPGTQFSGSNESAGKYEIDEPAGYPDFAQYFGSFSNTPITDVFREIEGFFKVQIDLQPGLVKSFSGTIQTGNLESALQIVCESLQLNYEFEDDYNIKILTIKGR